MILCVLRLCSGYLITHHSSLCAIFVFCFGLPCHLSPYTTNIFVGFGVNIGELVSAKWICLDQKMKDKTWRESSEIALNKSYTLCLHPWKQAICKWIWYSKTQNSHMAQSQNGNHRIFASIAMRNTFRPLKGKGGKIFKKL